MYSKLVLLVFLVLSPRVVTFLSVLMVIKIKVDVSLKLEKEQRHNIW